MPQNPSPSPGETQRSRRLKYGLNVLVAAVAALVIIIFINWIGYRQLFYRVDFTSSGSYSLSPQTRKVLENLQENYQIATLFRGADTTGGVSPSRAIDLVDEYARRSNKVTVEHLDPTIDVGRLDNFYSELRKRYTDQLKPMQTAVEHGSAALDELNDQIKTQLEVFETLRKNPDLGEGNLTAFVTQVSGLIGRLGAEIEDNKKGLKEFLKEEGKLPNYTAARDALKSALSSWDTKLFAPVVARFEKATQGDEAKPSVKENLLHLNELINRSRKTIAAALPALDAAQPVADYDQLSTQLAGQAEAVVIVGPKQVRVVPLEEMFRTLTPQQKASMRDEQVPDRDFLGEERITGALISMGLKNPPLVVFVYGGRQPALGPGGQYEQVADRLQKLNFKVDQWSPSGKLGPMGQMMPPGPPPTPDAGQKAVWIVLPIDPPNPMNPAAGGGSEQIAPVIQERLGAGDSALIMLNISPTARFGRGDPLIDVLQSWGIKAQIDRVVLHEAVLPNGQKQANNQLEVSQWPDDLPITKAMTGMTAIFLQGVPMTLTPPQDKSIQLWPLAVARYEGMWSETQVEGFPNIKLKPETQAASFIIAAAGESKTNRIIAVGDPMWASDQITTMGVLGPRTADLYGAAFPGNAELFVNSVLWLSHLDPLIAASARSQDIARIRPMSEGASRAIQWGLLVGMPLITLASGIGVWVVRRRG